jgi:hypothetical protein
VISKLDYQGETIQLARSYASFEEFRDDPHNLPDSEIPRVVGLVKNAVIPARHSTRNALDEFLLDRMMFPGHGLSLLQQSGPVALNAIEVPKMNEDRWVTAVPHRDHWLVIDDFVWPVAKGDIRRAEYDGTCLKYYDGAGILLREK